MIKIKMIINFCKVFSNNSLNKIVYLSSDAVYSDSEKKLKENSLKEPNNWHGLMHFLREQIIKKEVTVETLKVSLLLELTPKESLLIEQHKENLSISGFAVSPFGGNTFAVNSFPKFLSEDQVNKVLSAILVKLELFRKGEPTEEILRNISLTVAEFASIKKEQILEMREMESLLALWEAMGSPLSFMQDIPIFAEISMQELEKKLIT